MQTKIYDLVIIGGGPAGSCAAAFARQRGLSVCVVEKLAFPRFRIGESMLPMSNGVLRATGAWPGIEAAGFIPKHGARFVLADGTMEKRIDFSCGFVPGLESTYQVERAKFDGILLDHARSLGAEVRQPVTVTSVEPRADEVAVCLKTGDGSVETITARWLIDAGGRDNFYPSEAKRSLDPSPLAKRIAVYSHFKGIPRVADVSGGDTIVVRLDDGWFWLIPIDAERTSVGLVTTKESMRAAGGEPAAVFARAVEAAPQLRAWFAHATPTMGFHVTADYSYFRRELAHERIVLAGDAAGFFDPIFSSGAYMAMWSSQLAVEMIAHAHAAGRVLAVRERNRYAARVKAHAGVFAKLIRTFYDNDGFAVFLTPVPPLDLGRGLTSIVAGHARLNWGLWWRFSVFLGICRLQKLFRMVEPIAMPVRVAGA